MRCQLRGGGGLGIYRELEAALLEVVEPEEFHIINDLLQVVGVDFGQVRGGQGVGRNHDLGAEADEALLSGEQGVVGSTLGGLEVDDIEAVILLEPLQNLGRAGDSALVTVVESGRGETGEGRNKRKKTFF